jgi:tetratricopeptide (TPR) repeat protein
MRKFIFTTSFFLAIFFPFPGSAQNNDDLDNYIQRLKEDKAGPRKETGFLTAGSDFLYGQEYFDAKNYSSAAGYFMDAVKKQNDNAFANYQLAVSLIRQNDPFKKQQARPYLEAAFRLYPSLKERYKTDVPETLQAGNDQTPATTGTAGAGTSVGNKNSAMTGFDAYIARLRSARATGGAETAMNTAGRDALYGIESYEANAYDRAETNFFLALARDGDNPYINYLMAVSMAAQGKNATAKPYLQKAVEKDPSLAERYTLDVANAQTSWQKLVDAKKIKVTPPVKKAFGGALVFGNYTCHLTVWNGPNTSPAYSYQYKGYVALKADGTYRWLDDGETGKYKYDAKTGTLTWLSGYLKTSGARSTQYRINDQTAQMTIDFTDTYRWECGCQKK